MKIIKIKDIPLQRIIEQTVLVLKKGGLVVFPSDTVYGLLVDATNRKGVEKLIKFKNRPPGKAISVFVSGFKMLDDYTRIEKKKISLIKEFLPGRFTLILNSKQKVVSLLESEDKTIGIRFIKYLPISNLLKKFKKPITATSANLSGRGPHYSIDSLLKTLSNKKKQMINLVVDGGRLPHFKPSTVIDLTDNEPKVIREGDIAYKFEKEYISSSVAETKNIAHSIFSKLKNEKLLSFIIEGELGVGKTVFTKGLGEEIGVDNIISPSFVIYYEYRLKQKKIGFKKLIHFDLYRIEKKGEIQDLKIDNYLKEKNILCFEWGNRMGNFFEVLKKKTKVVYIKMEYLNEKKRKIKVRYF